MIADFDNDGWKDIFVTRGHVQSLDYASTTPVEQPNTVFRNLAGTRFQALTAPGLTTMAMPREELGRAAATLLDRQIGMEEPLLGVRQMFDAQLVVRHSSVHR